MLQKDSRKQVPSGIIPIAKTQQQFFALVVEEGLVLATTLSVKAKFMESSKQVQ